MAEGNTTPESTTEEEKATEITDVLADIDEQIGALTGQINGMKRALEVLPTQIAENIGRLKLLGELKEKRNGHKQE